MTVIYPDEDKVIKLRERFQSAALGAEELKAGLVEELGWSISFSAGDHKGVKSIDPRITHACDHECPHCWANIYGKHMTMEVFERTLDLAELSNIDTVQFTGGEPTLNHDMIAMAKRAKERGFNLILRSHGRMMPRVYDTETGQTWAQAVAASFDEIIVSIDGMAAENFQMRPVKRNQKLVLKVGQVLYAKTMNEVANTQFEETMAGYTALSRAVGNDPLKIIKINTVVAKANAHGMGEFGRYLSQAVEDGALRVDCWDLTQVFPSPESDATEQEAYVISDIDFFRAILEATFTSPNIRKRAKSQTSSRCLIIDESGRTYFGGEENLELGNVKEPDIDTISQKINLYDAQKDLSAQRAEKYLNFIPQEL